MKARAAVFLGVGRPFEVDEIDVDEPGGHGVVVAIKAVGICGTDLHSIRGDWTRPTPMVLGHEGAGVVEAVGAGVTRVAPGDEVVLSWAASCGECADCWRGRPAACTRLHAALGAGTLVGGETGMSWRGQRLYRGTATGALTERLVVDEGVVVPTGGGLPFEEAALLGCAAMTGVGAVLFAGGVEPGMTVLVIGAGGVGQFCVQGARIAGAQSILCIDPVAARRELALRVGATDAGAPEELETLVERAAPGGTDRTFDSVGAPETTALALASTRSAGTAVIVGLPGAGARLDLDPAEFIRREKHLTGSMYGSQDPRVGIPVLIEHARAGRLDLAAMVGRTYPLERIDDAIADSLQGLPGRTIVTI